MNAIWFPPNTLLVAILPSSTHEADHVMRYDPQIASRFEQMDLSIWGDSDEFQVFFTGQLKYLPVKTPGQVLNRRLNAYIIELAKGHTGDPLRRAALHAMTTRSQRLRLDILQRVRAQLPIIIGQRA